jgi:hypothetical protein
LSPGPGLRSTFGEELSGPLAEIVVRSWGALIGIVGLLLIYGAFHVTARRVALTVAAASKLIFIGLVLSLGRQYLPAAKLSVVLDSIMVLLFLWYLWAGREPASTTAAE